MVIMDDKLFYEINDYINRFNGLTMECEVEIVHRYPQIPENTLRSIVSKSQRYAIMTFFGKYGTRPDIICNE